MDTRKKFEYMLLLQPVVVAYMWVFYATSDVAKDRDAYIRIFTDPFDGRHELGYKILAHLFSSFLGDPELALALTQFLAMNLLVLFGLSYFKISPLTKTCLSLFIIFTVFSGVVGIQLRFGLAVILAVMCVSLQRRSATLLYIAPGLVHIGVIPFLMTAAYWRLSGRFGHKLGAVGLALLALSAPLLPSVIQLVPELLGLGGYYKGYFDPDGVRRLVPLQLVFYLLVLGILLLRRERIKSSNIWIAVSGLILPILFVFTELQVLYKLMIPFVLFTAIESIGSLHFATRDVKAVSTLALWLAPCGLLYLLIRTGYL